MGDVYANGERIMNHWQSQPANRIPTGTASHRVKYYLYPAITVFSVYYGLGTVARHNWRRNAQAHAFRSARSRRVMKNRTTFCCVNFWRGGGWNLVYWHNNRTTIAQRASSGNNGFTPVRASSQIYWFGRIRSMGDEATLMLRVKSARSTRVYAFIQRWNRIDTSVRGDFWGV